MNKGSKRILAVTIKRMVDYSPDTSYLGDYSNQPKNEFSIDREESGDRGRNEFRYFNSSDNYKGCTPEEIKSYTEQDYKRMESLNRGDWCYLGVSAEAKVSIPSGNGSVTSKVSSSGLWGIESDSEESYLAEIEKEQFGELGLALVELGFSKRAIATAFKEVKRTD